MYNRHDEVPVYEYRDGQVDAIHYNHVQVALKRLGREVRLDLPRLQSLDLILQKSAWVIVDRAFNDIPIAAWSDFQARGRDSLHQPVKCRIRIYHAYAGAVLRRSLEAMRVLLSEQLAGGRGGGVIPFGRRR